MVLGSPNNYNAYNVLFLRWAEVVGEQNHTPLKTRLTVYSFDEEPFNQRNLGKVEIPRVCIIKCGCFNIVVFIYSSFIWAVLLFIEVVTYAP
jgi:hypothetical protein